MPRYVPPPHPPPYQTHLPIPASGALPVEPLACLSLPICVPRVDRIVSLSSLLLQTPLHATPTVNNGPGPVLSSRLARLDMLPSQRRCCGGGGDGCCSGGGDYRSRVCNGVAALVVTTVPAAREAASLVTNAVTAVAPVVRP